MTMWTTSEKPWPSEVDTGNKVDTVTFTADGELLVNGGWSSVEIWRVKNCRRVATMKVDGKAQCVAASRDGRYIAAGTSNGEVLVWDAVKYKQIFTDKSNDSIQDVDFSPDSTRLVSAERKIDDPLHEQDDSPQTSPWWVTNHTTTNWDIASCRKVQTIPQPNWVYAAKYSPRGDRIATSTYDSVLVWDSSSGQLLVEIEGGAFRLFWYNNHLFKFVNHDGGKIGQINATTGTMVSEWPVVTDKNANDRSCIALPQHGKFIAYSAKKAVTFWDTATHSQFGPIRHTDDIHSIVCSSDGKLLAIAAGSKIAIRPMSFVTFPTALEPELHIDVVALNAWRDGQLTNAEALLSAAMPNSKNRRHVLASRSLVRARLGHWDAALEDAKESIKFQRSLAGYVAMFVALVGKGEEDEGFRVCDIAFHHFRSDHLSLLLVIKAVALFMAGKHVDGLSRMNDLITNVGVDMELYVVQAYMYLILGNSHMESSDYECAVRSFEEARAKLGDGTRRPPLIVLLVSGWNFDGLVITIQQRLCEALLAAGRMTEIWSIFSMIGQKNNMTELIEAWVSDFKSQWHGKLEDLGDHAMDAKRYSEAVSKYTAALSLDPACSQYLRVKRSKVYAEQEAWIYALDDADEAIKLDPSSPLGYERKCAALHGMGHHDAIYAFDTMLLKMSESSDPEIRERSHHHIQIKETIRTSIENVVRHTPEVLIRTSSGRLCNKSEQAAAFESSSIFLELVLSMTTQIDHVRIEQVVGEFYRYATLSHTWEGNEPLYEMVTKIVVYDLEGSSTHEKLRMFCKIVRDEGFIWAWSDTCCINKGDLFILQEALVSMFKWYEGSAMTIIYLCDVDTLAGLGVLMTSRWNSRGWTLQEYLASKVVRIYTKDWKPYLGLTIYNHKESPEVISEMELATGISARALVALRPGLNDIREKLRLASTRRTTRVEDAAYSLLGIFSMSLPVTYGEGDTALGRLLSQLLASSGDTSILAWTGTPGSFNSCLPTNIIVFSEPLTSHIPPAITGIKMREITAGLPTSSLDLSLITRLYDQLNGVSMPFFVGQRMKLPCLAFKIDCISTSWGWMKRAFHVQAGALRAVDIKTNEDLSRLDSLYLVHPWIDFLLDRRPVRSYVETTRPMENDSSVLDSLTEPSGTPDEDSLAAMALLSSTASPMEKRTHVKRVLTRLKPLFGTRLPKLTHENVDKRSRADSVASIHAYEFLARLSQPFGALLLTPTRRNVEEYRRVATECLITVQVEELTSATLERLIQNVRVLDVL